MVLFEKNIPTKLGAGKMDNYEPLLKTMGKLVIGSGRMMVEGMQPVLFSKYTLYVRMQAALELGKDIRVIANNRIFRIESFKEIGQKKFFYKIELNGDE